MSKELDKIAGLVDQLRGEVGDEERAHGLEDHIYKQALKHVAAGAPDAPEIAAKALEAEALDFERWYA